MPLDGAIISVPSECGLIVRYPIRMFEDLLPYRRLSGTGIVERLQGLIESQQGVSMDLSEILNIAEHQILLKGTLTLHSNTAARNGGEA